MSSPWTVCSRKTQLLSSRGSLLNVYSHTLNITHLKKRPLVKRVTMLVVELIQIASGDSVSFFLTKYWENTALGKWVTSSVLQGPAAEYLVPAGEPLSFL